MSRWPPLGTALNDAAGTFALHYFAPDPTIALLEAVAFHGSYASGFVTAPPLQAWTVFRYRIAKPLKVVNFADPTVRNAADTTTQELTGDWLGYHHRHVFRALPPHLPAVGAGQMIAPTQQIANDVYATGAHGLLAPSAKFPLVANLALFYGRLPTGTLHHTGTATRTL